MQQFCNTWFVKIRPSKENNSGHSKRAAERKDKMKKIFVRSLAIILATVTLLGTAFSAPTKANAMHMVGRDYNFDEMFNGDLIFDDIINELSDLPKSEDIKKVVDSLSDADVQKIAAAVNKMSVMGYISAVASGASSAYTVLCLIGACENYEQKTLRLLQEFIESSNDNFARLNENIENMSAGINNKLDAALKMIRENIVATKKVLWNQFNETYINPLETMIAEFADRVNAKILDVVDIKRGTICIFYNEEGNICLPERTDWKKLSEVFDINGNKIVKIVEIPVKDTTFAESRNYVNRSISNSKFYSAMKADIRNAIAAAMPAKSDEELQKLTEDVIVSLGVQAQFEVFTEKKSDAGDCFANEYVRKYNVFADAICKGDSITAMHEIYKLSFNFQSEARTKIEAFNTLMLNKIVEYTEFANAAADFFTGMEKVVKTELPVAKAKVDTVLDENRGLVPEKENAEFCYITNSYIALDQYTLKNTDSVDAYIEERGFSDMPFCGKGLGIDEDSVKSKREWVGNKAPQNNGFDQSDIAQMVGTYETLVEKGLTDAKNFNEYFIGKLAKNSELNTGVTGLIIGTTKTSDFAVDGTKTLNCMVDATNYQGSYFTQFHKYRIGKDSDGNSAANKQFLKHVTTCGTLFNLVDCVTKDNADLLTTAVYAHSNWLWTVCEGYIFSGAADLPNEAAWFKSQQNAVKRTNPGFWDHWEAKLTYGCTTTATFWGVVTVD